MTQPVLLDLSIRSTETRLFNGDGCPLEYLLTQRDLSLEIERPDKFWFVSGTLLHKFVEDAILTNPRAARQAMLESIELINEAELIHAARGSTEELGLASFCATWADRWIEQYDLIYGDLEPTAIELKLDVPVNDEVTLVTTVDAVFVDEDDWPIVVDWKFGSSKSGKPMQLFVYWYGLRKAGIVPDDAWFRGWFHYVQQSSPTQEVGNYPGDDFVETYIIAADWRKKQGLFLPNPSWFACRYCDYQEECPLYAEEPAIAWQNIMSLDIDYV